MTMINWRLDESSVAGNGTLQGKMVVKSREIDRTSRSRHSLRTGNELWTLDHILVLGKTEE
jgi:hypothetical protein